MIIFGTRGVTRTKESGEFVCPGCGGTQQPYQRKTVRRFFTLYFIPIIPLDQVGEYIECQRCHNSYNEQVLHYDPAAQQAKKRAEFVEHLKRVMILTALADGSVNDGELKAIRELHHRLSGATLSGPDLERELALARQAGISPGAYARRFAGELNEHGKEMVIKAVHSVLVAGGDLEQPEYDLLNEVATALNLSEAHFRGILSTLNDS
jgi:tellurite resistance protein